MAASLRHEGGDTYSVEIHGRLSKADLDAVQRSAVAEIERVGRIRLLFELKDFTGWERGDNWSDLRFYVRHGNDIARIAIVGEERWRDEALMFAAADLRAAEVAFFPTPDRARALDWLRQ